MADAFDEKKIDLVGISPDGSTVSLFIVQSGEWTGSETQVHSLQAKIHNYLSFALDGQMVRTYPETASLTWEIVISCLTGLPDSHTKSHLERLSEVLPKYGGTLRVQERESPPSL